ncbi:MAG: hypothetical protein ACLQLC_02365 [Candidatus Sulfotelmatobacter sp.]
MLRIMIRISFFFSLMLVATFAASQAEFSAEMVNLQKPDHTVKVYFTKDKMRAEMQDSGPRGGGVAIVNFATQNTLVLMPQQHMYMEMPMQAQKQRMSYANDFFHTGDVENACSDWQKLAYNKSVSCHRVGDETVNGRSTVKYESTNTNGDVGQFWLDTKLRFPVKWQYKDDKWELRNIQEGAQPASLFEVPAGYNKMDLGGMMQQPH